MARSEVGVAAGTAYATRRGRIRSRLDAEGLAGLVVTSHANVRYLSGFTGSAGALVVTRSDDVFLTDFRYRDQASDELDPEIEVRIVSSSPWDAACELAAESRLEPTGFEREHVSVARWEAWRRDGGPETRGVEGWVESLRASKSPSEIRAIERSATIALRAFEQVLGDVRPGVAERDLAAELDRRLVAAGAERPAFETIVASGPRAALPHARPTERRIAAGEGIQFDFGAVVDGYHSDLSRVVCLGEPEPEWSRVYALVHEARRVAIEGARSGMTGRAADRLARSVIEAAGHGEDFGHSLGHGIGLEVHEAPGLSSRNEEPLPEGAVVTVEPGIYIRSRCGVRLEDDVVLRPDGARILATPAPASPIVL